jgi:hypothetical protein
MTAVHSRDLDIYIARQFKKSVSDDSNVYLTFGNTTPWINESNPPNAGTSVVTYYRTWKSMVGGKKINGSDIHHVIPRYNWTSNTVYFAYDDIYTTDYLITSNSKFYVMTDEFNVYKCIANNYGKASTFKPTSTNPASVFQTADQYTWKYMYTLTGEEQLRFTTGSFIPVKTLAADDNSLQWQVQDFAVFGAINNILVTGAGTGYTSNNISVTIRGDGRFANAYAIRNVTTSTIQSIVIDTKGSGYTYATATITSSLGSGATARVVIDPPKGHGSDALHELGGSFLMLNVKLDGTEDGKLPVVNDYRQISIIENPLVYGETNVISNLAFSQVTTLSLGSGSTATDYTQDEIVYQGSDLANATYKGIVTQWDSANSLLKITNVEGTPTAQLLIGNTSTTSRYVSSVTNPDLEPYSGYLLYKDNIVAIERAEDQSEDFKIVLSF